MQSNNQTAINQLNNQSNTQSHHHHHLNQQTTNLTKNQQTNLIGNGQLPSLHELTIKTNQAVAAANAILNCSPSSLSSNSTSPLNNQHLPTSNLSTSNNSSDSNTSNSSPSLARNSKESKVSLTDCKSEVLNGNWV